MNIRIVIDGTPLGGMVDQHVDWNATEAKIRAAITEYVAVQCAIDSSWIDVEVSYSIDRDRVYVTGEAMNARYLSEDVRAALIDFPWYDDSRWAVYT